MKDKLTAQDKRVLEIADRYVNSYIQARVYKFDPVDWREYYKVTRNQLLTYARRLGKR